MMSSRLSLAFQKAAEELGFEYISPFALRGPADGKEVMVSGFLPFVGNEKGAIIVAKEDPDVAFDLADELGHFSSGLGGEYETYDRALFLETLRDWGWHGPAKERPSLFGNRK